MSRLMVLLSALAATVAAIFYPVDDPTTSVPTTPRVLMKDEMPVSAVTTAGSTLDWIATDENPFAQQLWLAPQPPPPAQPPAPAPVVALETVAAPQLPFKFVGQMVDGGNRVVYLTMNEQMVLARSGDMLEGGYKVLEITPAHIEFESTSHGIRQMLQIPAQEN